MKKLISTLMSLLLLIQIAPAVAAKQKGDWTTVKSMVDRSVAVKTRSGETHFGLIRSADDSSITIQIAGRDDFTSQEINFRRDEVIKVWQAKLRFDEANVAKGAWIGAGIGLGVSIAVTLALAARDDADANAGGAFGPLIGAGAGAIVGMFWKKKHKKQELVYSV
jgi:hypothetical protein